MSDKKRSAKGKWKNALLAAALTASVILALPAWSVGHAEATETTGTATGNRTSERLDWEKTPTLTITRADKSVGNLEVDLYLVATAKRVDGYDTYTLELQEPYNSKAPEGEKSISDLLDEAMETKFGEDGSPINPNETGVNVSYRELAQKVAAKALELKEKTTGEGEDAVVEKVLANGDPDYTIELPGEPTKDLPAGMYLVVPHGENLKPEQYIRWMSADETKEDAPPYYDAAGDKIVTIAFSEGYIYSYLPELISIPSKENSGGGFNTAQPGNWIYDVTALLKSQREVQMASLEITKKLKVAPLTSDSCVFHIKAELEGKTVYESYKSVTFEKNETEKTVTLEGLIPVGATVTVTEEVSGASYKIDNENNKTQTIEAQADTVDDQTHAVIGINNRVEFTNNRQDSGAGSGAITNNFKYNEDGGWQWTRDPEADTTDDNT